MSDTHAQTASAQADVQTGHPHIPPGHVEAEKPAIDPAHDRPAKPFVPWFTAGALAVVAIVAIVIAAT